MNEMTRMFNQAMCLPFTTFASGVEMMTRGMETWARPSAWTGAMDRGGSCGEPVRCEPVRCEPVRDEQGYDCGQDREWDGCGSCGRSRRDCCCRDRGCGDTVRLVEWALVSVARHGDYDAADERRGGGQGEGDERRGGGQGEGENREGFRRPLDRGEMVVSDCVSDEELRSEILVDYGRRHPKARAKNLRVYLRVLSCWRRNDWDYEQEQIDALRGIRRAIEQQQKQ